MCPQCLEDEVPRPSSTTPAHRMSPSGNLAHAQGVAVPGHVCHNLLKVHSMLQIQSRKGLALLNVETETPGSGKNMAGTAVGLR